MKYDILHVEDDLKTREFLEGSLTRRSLTYFGVSCLKALEDALPGSSGRIFVVDGRFPRVDGSQVEQLATVAIGAIRQHYPDARILLYSLERGIDTIAEQNGVEYRRKVDFSPTKLATELKTLLE